MVIPKYTADIFDVLAKGQFISSNSQDEHQRKLFAQLEDPERFEFFSDYFGGLRFALERGDEYFYFSRTENRVDLERKIEQAFKWIDALDFLKTVDNAFGPGYRFTPAEILVRVGVDAELKAKMDGLKRTYTGKQKYADVLDKLLDDLRRDRFIEMENEMTQQYKVLAAFHYLEQLVLAIHIHEEAKDEIPE